MCAIKKAAQLQKEERYCGAWSWPRNFFKIFSLTTLVEKSRGHQTYRPGLYRAECLGELDLDWEENQHYERVIPVKFFILSVYQGSFGSIFLMSEKAS